MKGAYRMVKFSGTVYASGKTLTEDGLKAAWKAIDAIKTRQEEPIAREYRRLLKKQEKSVLDRWERVGPGQVQAKNREIDAMLGSLVFDVGEWLSEVAEDFEPLILAVIEEGFRTGALAINESMQFSLTPRARIKMVGSIGRIQGTNITTRDSIGRAIRDGLESGDTVDDIAAALKGMFTEWSSYRARLVAQTETTNAFEAAQQDAWMEAGVEKNRWLSMRDDRVRPEHDLLDGEEVMVGEAFSNGLEHPSEPNCRCVLLPVGVQKTWRKARDSRMRAKYHSIKHDFPQWEQAVEAVMDTEEGRGLSFETVRAICHSRK